MEKYSINSPKKDQCDICTSYNTANITEEEHKQHILLKTEARLEKNRDNEIALNDESTVVLYIDLQKVLLSRSIQASAVYYKTKLCCYNYTIYDKKTKQATCYIWSETEADLSSNTCCAMLFDYLTTNLRCINANNIVIYTDGCPYQNRCVPISNCLLLYTKLNTKVVVHKYLCKGHTQMEVDSVHAVIERALRNQNVYSPAGMNYQKETTKI